MARFIPGVLGTPIGKLNNQVFRQMNGKIFVSNRPEKFNISQTAKAKASRNSFGLVVKFAKLITSSPELSGCWKQAKIEGTSAYHRVIKHNLSLTKDGLLTKNNIICPTGFDMKSDVLTLENHQLTFKLVLDNSLNGKNYNSLNIYNILFLYQPSTKKTKYDFLINNTIYLTDKKEKEIQFSVNFSKSEKILFKNYDRFLIYTVLVALKGNKIITHSSTVTKSFVKDKTTPFNFVQI